MDMQVSIKSWNKNWSYHWTKFMDEHQKIEHIDIQWKIITPIHHHAPGYKSIPSAVSECKMKGRLAPVSTD